MNVYEIITSKVIEQLEKGTVPWRKPWNTSNAPRSLATGKQYRGLNVFLLLATPFRSPWWGTWNQIESRGGKVKDDQRKSYTIVIFWKLLRQTDEATGREKTVPLLRYFRVYNLEQTEGVALTAKEQALTTHAQPLSEDEAHEDAERIIEKYAANGGPRTRHDDYQAYYQPASDTISLPNRETFESVAEYYSTRFHEMTHSTGHESRLNRHTGTAVYGNHEYGREELVAEMGSAFLMGEAGILSQTIGNSAAYIKGWMTVIREDVKAVVVAAGAAQRAADYILGHTLDEERLS